MKIVTIGMMMVYQSNISDAKAGPGIEFGPLCMEVQNSCCEYEFIMEDYVYVDFDPGVEYHM